MVKVPCLDCGRIHEQTDACPVDWEQPEQGRCVHYATMKGSDMSGANNPDYRWRPATAGDIGSIARFGDTESNHEPWEFGILLDIERCYQSPVGYKYTYKSGPCYEEDETLVAFVCQIQYDGSKEP